jgi:16S rRNA (guanine966-N2)-methyltransferase
LIRGQHNRLRIIGGRWRGRKLDFPDVEGLRPTPDRVRETLFNWLQDDIVSARCLDLFSGSGALGLEALSRGASYVLMVDSDKQVVNQISKHLVTLQATSGEILQADTLQLLSSETKRGQFDVVFLDPPFDRGLIEPCVDKLVDGDWLAEHAKIYIESETGLRDIKLPKTWEIIRDKTAGQVRYCLART